ncbi:AAA family ATPase [Phaeodactylibacter xiamenensis]|uniref:AAA family ATPase n=1 Tax=Phaeodactylibacter xiamenensis TaxID=1524460 RepID=UPI0024A94AD1|nr:AAA family ATPase [Phaeodactylibacter xiamenensis]
MKARVNRPFLQAPFDTGHTEYAQTTVNLMSHIKQITLTNFRVFKEKTHFQLAPITVLTGTNSSGKSSLGKMMSLLQDNILGNDGWTGLDFSLNNHKLGGFKQSINKDAESDTFKVSFMVDTRLEYENAWREEQGNPFRLTDDFECELGFVAKGSENARLSELTFRAEKTDLLTMKWAEEEVKVTMDLEWAWEKIKEKLSFVSPDVLRPLHTEEPEDSKEFLKTISKEEALRHFKYQKLVKQHFGYAFHGLGEQLIACKDGFLQDDFIESVVKPLLEKSKQEESIIENKEYLERAFLLFASAESYDFGYGDAQYSIDTRLAQSIVYEYFNIRIGLDQYRPGFGIKYHMLERKISDYLTNEGEPIYLKVGEGRIGDEPFKEMIKPEFTAFFEYLSRATKGMLRQIQSTKVSNIEAIRANSQRLYTNQSQGTGFNELLIRLRNEPLSEKELAFVNKWIKQFKLGDELIIEGVEGVATKVSLLKNGKRLALADLGYGITQLLPVILSIAQKSRLLDETEVNSHRDIFFIEEPESNLHPALQSKLADFFYDAYQTFNAQFVLESHSEYLVRKLQYLVAKGKMKSEDTVIHYLYDPDAIPEGEPQLKKIRIEANGQLSDSFGRGFFDEADLLAMDLFTMNNDG